MAHIYVIGDIHGCYDELRALLNQIDICWQFDQLVFLGDYIDRGHQSYEVVAFLIELKARHPNTIFLKGNHEDMLLEFLSGNNTLSYMLNGGRQTLDSYRKHMLISNSMTIPQEHLDFFDSLVLCHQTDDYIFVHAGLRPGVCLEAQVPDDLLWIREPFIGEQSDFGKRVIFGHTAFSNPLVEPNKIGIDTGAVYDNRLTCLRLPDLTFYSV